LERRQAPECAIRGLRALGFHTGAMLTEVPPWQLCPALTTIIP
jgi:hypothetical protein